MINKDNILTLQNKINNEESDRFLNFYYGKFFSGDITLIEDEEIWTLAFYKGRCISVERGIPNTGIDIGVQGTKEDWDKFKMHKSLSVATNRGNTNNLTILGGAIRVRQNFNVVAQVIRVYSCIE